jgi:hypothetical protein
VLAFREGLFPLRIYDCLLRSRDVCDFIFTHCYSFGLLYDTTNSPIRQFAGLLVGVWLSHQPPAGSETLTERGDLEADILAS